MRQAAKDYLLGIGYWGLLMLLPIALDIIGIVFLIVAPARWVGFTFLGIGIVLAFIVPFLSYAKLHKNYNEVLLPVRLSARVGRWCQNVPNPGADKESLEVYLVWDMWVDRQVTTNQLALNLIYVYEKRWWKLWEKGRSPVFGMTRNGAESTQYRKILAPPGPDSDEGVFTWIGDKAALKDVQAFRLELVLTTAMPTGRYSTPVFIDWNEIRSRGTNPPL